MIWDLSALGAFGTRRRRVRRRRIWLDPRPTDDELIAPQHGVEVDDAG